MKRCKTKITVPYYFFSYYFKILGCLVCFGNRHGELDETITSRYRKWSAAEKNTPDRPGKPIYSENPVEDFLNYLFYETNPQYRNIVHSHNGGRYDMILMLREAYPKQNLAMQMVARGHKLYKLNFRSKSMSQKRKMTLTSFHDTINIIPIALSRFVKTLDLRDEEGELLKTKGDFPFLFQPADDDYSQILPKPPSEAHFPIFKKSKDVIEFIKKYNTISEKPFPIAEMMDSYCSNDVFILANGMVRQRERMLQITKNLDILR